MSMEAESHAAGCKAERAAVMPSQRAGGSNVEKSWSAWYAAAREEVAFRYGLRRIPTDRYKEQWALGETPHGAAKRIYEGMHARGEIK